MYQSHPLLSEPADETVLWRYMDIISLQSILITNTLYFPRVTELNDPFEGHPPKSIIDAYRNSIIGLEGEELKKQKDIAKHNLEVFRNGRKLMTVSCWHMNEVESDAMWKLYGNSAAIRTTFGRFKECFGGDKTTVNVNGGMVEYIDHETYLNKEINIITWAILKGLTFKHEQEFRGLVLDDPNNPIGVNIPIDVNTLIESIYVSPTMPEWQFLLLPKIIGTNFNINRTNLDIDPNYYKLFED